MHRHTGTGTGTGTHAQAHRHRHRHTCTGTGTQAQAQREQRDKEGRRTAALWCACAFTAEPYASAYVTGASNCNTSRASSADVAAMFSTCTTASPVAVADERAGTGSGRAYKPACACVPLRLGMTWHSRTVLGRLWRASSCRWADWGTRACQVTWRGRTMSAMPGTAAADRPLLSRRRHIRCSLAPPPASRPCVVRWRLLSVHLPTRACAAAVHRTLLLTHPRTLGTATGIFAYLNYRVPRTQAQVVETLLDGLGRLEYRGYDSAGPAHAPSTEGTGGRPRVRAAQGAGRTQASPLTATMPTPRCVS
jgi:hypothetical protein